MPIKVRWGDVVIESDTEAELKAVLRTLGVAPSANGNFEPKHATRDGSTESDRAGAEANPAGEPSASERDTTALRRLITTLPMVQLELARFLAAHDNGVTDVDIGKHFGFERNRLNGVLMTFSKKAMAQGLSLYDDVLLRSVTRGGPASLRRVYSYGLRRAAREALQRREAQAPT
jgi:hypothetical protein